MKYFLSILIPAVAAYLLSGWLGGGNPSRLQLPTKSDNSPRFLQRPQVPDGVSSRFVAVEKASTESERLKAAIELAWNLPISEASDWIERGYFRHRKGLSLLLFQTTLDYRWRQENPTGYLLWKIERGMEPTEEELSQAISSSPEALLASILCLERPEHRFSALQKLARIEPQLVLAEMKKGGTMLSADQQQLTAILYAIAEADLNALERGLPELPYSFQRSADDVLLRRRLHRDVENGVRALFDHPDGLSLLYAEKEFLSNHTETIRLLIPSMPPRWQGIIWRQHDLIARDLNELYEINWSELGYDSERVEEIKSYALRSMLAQSPGQAELLFATYEPDRELRKDVINSLYWGGYQHIIDNLMPVLDEADRAYYQRVTEGGGRSASSNLTFSTAQELVELLRDVELVKAKAYGRQMADWTRSQNDAFLRSYQSLGGDDRLTIDAFLTHCDQGPNARLRMESVRAALGDPRIQEKIWWNESLSTDHVSRVALQLFYQEPGTATAWIASLPQGPERELAIINVGRTWKNLDPASAQSWISALSQKERELLDQ